MATSVYSTRFMYVNAGGGSAFYTVPAGHLAVVRDVHVFQNTGGAGEVWDLISATHGYVIASGVVAAATGSDHWTGRQVVEPGEVMETSGGGSGTWSLAVSGYLLSLP